MLALVLCPEHERWLKRALRDHAPAVRETAMIVASWVHPGQQVTWPEREAVEPEATVTDAVERHGSHPPGGRGYEWEYTVEVWRTDGQVVGSFFVKTCAEDDAHARSLALGQAILASTAACGERFDPEHAATFVVEKVHREGGATRSQPPLAQNDDPTA